MTNEQEEIVDEEIDLSVEQAANDAEAEMTGSTSNENYMADDDDGFDGDEYDATDGDDNFADDDGESNSTEEPKAKAEPTTSLTVREALTKIRKDLGEQQYQRLMSEHDDAAKQAQILRAMMTDPRAQRAYDAVYNPHTEATPTEQVSAAVQINHEAIDKALDEGASVGQVVAQLIQQTALQNRVQIRQEMTSQIEQMMTPTIQHQQAQQATEAFSSFATNHDGLMEDMELRGVMGDIIRNNPTVVADIPGRKETFNQKMTRVMKYAQAELGRSVKSPNPQRANINKQRNLAARAVGRTGRNVTTTTKRTAQTLEEAASMAEDEVMGMRR